MTTYAVGDVQGCYAELMDLLDAVSFGRDDQLWLAGDLINRGPDSKAVVKFAMGLGSRVTTVLGNHDLHLLAIYYGGHKVTKSDTFDALLANKHMDAIGDWYCQQPLLVVDSSASYAVPTYVMAHAGLPHCWTIDQAQGFATEVQDAIRGEQRDVFFQQLYGNKPNCWQADLEGMDRLRIITNYFTRMRLVHADGTLNFSHKSTLDSAPAGWSAWFDVPPQSARPESRIIFGHWAALDGAVETPTYIGLDTGCVWGRSLSALCLETGVVTRVPART